MQYLRNAQSDFDPVFLLVCLQQLCHSSSEKNGVYPPPPSGLKEFLLGCNMASESHTELPRRRVLPVIKVFQP